MSMRASRTYSCPAAFLQLLKHAWANTVRFFSNNCKNIILRKTWQYGSKNDIIAVAKWINAVYLIFNCWARHMDGAGGGRGMRWESAATAITVYGFMLYVSNESRDACHTVSCNKELGQIKACSHKLRHLFFRISYNKEQNEEAFMKL